MNCKENSVYVEGGFTITRECRKKKKDSHLQILFFR